jgi:small-conductance mechanosensitive channel
LEDFGKIIRAIATSYQKEEQRKEPDQSNIGEYREKLIQFKKEIREEVDVTNYEELQERFEGVTDDILEIINDMLSDGLIREEFAESKLEKMDAIIAQQKKNKKFNYPVFKRQMSILISSLIGKLPKFKKRRNYW